MPCCSMMACILRHSSASSRSCVAAGSITPPAGQCREGCRRFQQLAIGKNCWNSAEADLRRGTAPHRLTHDDKVGEASQALVASVPLCESRQVLHLVQPRHGEQHGLAALLQLACLRVGVQGMAWGACESAWREGTSAGASPQGLNLRTHSSSEAGVKQNILNILVEPSQPALLLQH